MDPSTARDCERLNRERQKFKTKVSQALSEEDDPLAVYDQFVRWTIKNYGENDPESGLLELLEEATRVFKNDGTYKTDLRYLKLWSLYARQVDRSAAISIFEYLIANEIGTRYSMLYEEYATLLEVAGRRSEAEDVYRNGIERQVRPLERLKNRYRSFQTRSSLSPTACTQPSTMAGNTKSGTPTNILKHDPLINHCNPKRAVSTTSSASSTSNTTSVQPSNPISLNSSPQSRYALMLAPPAKGKRPEKLRFNLSLLFTEECGEYSIQEARARSIGLLNKKWGPPAASELTKFYSQPSASSSVPVDFNEDGQRSTRTMGLGKRKSLAGGGAEPTVTINTKEALEDVFGMYNSPEKTVRSAGLPGSKHAPLKKVDAVMPMVPARKKHVQETENAIQNVKSAPAFRPFIDENANMSRKENATPALAKFKAYVDPDVNRAPFTPRPALASKDPSISKSEENVPKNINSLTKLTTVPEGVNVENVFSKVFIPAHSLPLAPLRDVFTDDHGKPQPKPKPPSVHARARSHHGVLSPASAPTDVFEAATPFNENSKTPFKVFSRPPVRNENENNRSDSFAPIATPVSNIKVSFMPLKKDNSAEDACGDTAAAAPLASEIHSSWSDTTADEQDPVQSQIQDDSEDEDKDRIREQYETPLFVENGESEYDEGESYREVPLGGRFGQFNVMTPITERTFEFTTSTRSAFDGTPSERLHLPKEDGGENGHKPFSLQKHDEYGAMEAAERLAAELREEGDDEYEEDEDAQALQPLRLSDHLIPPKEDSGMAMIEEKTGTLSLLDTLTLTSKFRPPNPCNPFDPPIMATLLSLVPSDPMYHDLRGQEANLSDALQRFAKRSRKTSGNTTNTGRLDLTCFPLTLAGRKFSILEVLGEGGFGTVFKARDLSLTRRREEDDGSDEDTDDEDEDEDEDGSSTVALKVVRPRNIWEYHVLRRLHSTLSVSLRRSIILPHALYAFRDESFLVLDYCPQGTLLNIVNNAGPAGVSQQGACLDELLVFFFTIELFRLLEGMHSHGFIHGDLKIDNCLLRLEDVPGGATAWSSVYQPSGEGGWSYKGVRVIDFGRTIDTKHFPSGQEFIAEWATDERDCVEIRENRPWTFQTDYFGLAGIIYCMLFGKYIHSSSIATLPGTRRYKIATPLKRYWQTGLWNRIFDVLLNPGLVRPDSQLPVCDELGALRKEMETWLQGNCNRTSNTLKGLLKKVEVSCFVR